MVRKSKGRSRPVPDASILKNVAYKLEEALTNEVELFNNYSERKPWEVTMSARDCAVQNLRFLRVWFDLPQAVFFSAVSYLDQFLARIKVQEKFLSCLSISCFSVAAAGHGFKIDASQLVILSQSKCSIKDAERMSRIVTEKLNPGDLNDPLNAFDLLKIYLDVFKFIAAHFKTEGILKKILKLCNLSTRLEILVSNSDCATFKPSLLSLAFIQFEMEQFLSREMSDKSTFHTRETFYMLALMIELQCISKIDASNYCSCFEAVSRTLKAYDNRKKSSHSQKLIWRFSHSTYAISKATQNYYSTLNTVKEE